jgi:hypothetical protein
MVVRAGASTSWDLVWNLKDTPKPDHDQLQPAMIMAMREAATDILIVTARCLRHVAEWGQLMPVGSRLVMAELLRM